MQTNICSKTLLFFTMCNVTQEVHTYNIRQQLCVYIYIYTHIYLYLYNQTATKKESINQSIYLAVSHEIAK